MRANAANSFSIAWLLLALLSVVAACSDSIASWNPEDKRNIQHFFASQAADLAAVQLSNSGASYSIMSGIVKEWGRCLTLHLVEQGKQSNQASVSLVEKAKVSASVVSAAHLLESGSDVRPFQELLGHRDVKPTMISMHVLNRDPGGVRSPLDGW